MKPSKPVFMGTTSISAEKSASEVSSVLAQAGAEQVMINYDQGQAVGLSFVLDVRGKRLGFRLPVRTESLFEILNRKRSTRTRHVKARDDREQANRVAWRQILMWVKAQLAIIQTGMVQPAEVFMPYLVMNSESGPTMFEAFAEKQKLLPVLGSKGG